MLVTIHKVYELNTWLVDRWCMVVVIPEYPPIGGGGEPHVSITGGGDPGVSTNWT